LHRIVFRWGGPPGLFERARGPRDFVKNPDGWADPLVRPRGGGLRPAMPAFLRASAGREDAARNGGMASRRLAPQTRTDACAGFSTLRWQATENDGLPHCLAVSWTPHVALDVPFLMRGCMSMGLSDSPQGRRVGYVFPPPVDRLRFL